MICVRPEDFQIKRPSAADNGDFSTAIPGRVTAKAFLGNIIMYKVMGLGQEFQVQTDPTSDPMVNPDDPVLLRPLENRIKLVG